MFSKEESARIRQEFWTSFGKSFPRKWLLYNTRIKGLSLKFYADRKKAGVCLDIEHPDPVYNEILWEQISSLKNILTNDYLPDVIFEKAFVLDNGKEIHRIYVPLGRKFSIHNKNTWRACYEFFLEKMSALENFFKEYQDYIKGSIE